MINYDHPFTRSKSMDVFGRADVEIMWNSPSGHHFVNAGRWAWLVIISRRAWNSFASAVGLQTIRLCVRSSCWDVLLLEQLLRARVFSFSWHGFTTILKVNNTLHNSHLHRRPDTVGKGATPWYVPERKTKWGPSISSLLTHRNRPPNVQLKCLSLWSSFINLNLIKSLFR